MSKSKCEWIVDEEFYWVTGCGEKLDHRLPQPNHKPFNYCPYCGKPIKIVKDIKI